MDTSNFFKADSFRNFVGITLPGYIASWPFLFYILMKFQLNLNEFEFLIIFIWTIVSIGLGMILEDVGGWIELIFEQMVIKDKDLIDFYWRRYLLYVKEEHATEAKMIRYISSIVVRMKFELNMIVAICIMIISQIIFQTTTFTVFENNCLLVIFICLFIFIIAYLIYESKKSIKTLHDCRKRLIDFYDYPDEPKSLKEGFANKKFENYKN